MTEIDKTLEDRNDIYDGSFKCHAYMAQRVKLAMYASKNWDRLSDDQREALEMIAHNIGRILNGNKNSKESWRDIGVYAELVERRLND